MPTEIENWYIVEIENNPFLRGTFEYISKYEIIEPITRISCYPTEGYYVIETEEDNYKCLFSEEVSDRHCKKAFKYLEEAQEKGMCFIFRLSPAHFYEDEIELIAERAMGELSPEILHDMKKPLDYLIENAVKQFIRVKFLDYPEGAIPDGTDDLIFKKMIQIIRN